MATVNVDAVPQQGVVVEGINELALTLGNTTDSLRATIKCFDSIIRRGFVLLERRENRS